MHFGYSHSFVSVNSVCTSSNINEVIRPVLNFLFFFHDKISQVQKSTKKHQKAPKSTKKHQKTQEALKNI